MKIRKRRERKASRAAALLCLGVLAAPGSLGAQQLGARLRSLTIDNARLYAGPVLSGLSSAFSSDFFSSAAVHRPLGFTVGLRGAGAFVPGGDDTFVPVLPTSVEYGGRSFADPYAPKGGAALLSPSATGAGPGLTLAPQGEFRDALIADGRNPDAYDVQLPPGFDVPAVPLGVVEADLGLPLGTEVMVRFLPSVDLGGDIGTLRLFGLGVQHSISQWIRAPLPFDVAAGLSYQHFEASEYLDASSLQSSLIVGRDIGPLGVHGALNVGDSNLDVRYVVENPAGDPTLPPDGTELSFRADDGRGVTATVGAGLQLLVFRLDVAYTAARYPVLGVNLLLNRR